MASYLIQYSCGHVQTIILHGRIINRVEKIMELEKHGLCPECYKERKNMDAAVGCNEIRMPYEDYVAEYKNCTYKEGSYDGETKTITVFVPKDGYNITR